MKIWGTVALLVVLTASVLAAAKPQNGQDEPPFPATLRNARFVYVTSYDGDQFDPRLLPEDRQAISNVQDSIEKWGKLTLVYRPQDADIVLMVESRPSEDILAVYNAHLWPESQYLWRVMGRSGLQAGETPLVTKFEKAFEGVIARVNNSQPAK
jgi:hypothetical protein